MYEQDAARRTKPDEAEPEGFFGWLLADLNHLIGSAALLVAVLVVFDLIVFGRPNRSRCGHPRKKGGHCGNPAPPPGGRCAAGHGSGWIFFEVVGGAALLIFGAYALLSLPFPESVGAILGVLNTSSD